jgi:hypothetical protein
MVFSENKVLPEHLELNFPTMLYIYMLLHMGKAEYKKQLPEKGACLPGFLFLTPIAGKLFHLTELKNKPSK